MRFMIGSLLHRRGGRRAGCRPRRPAREPRALRDVRLVDLTSPRAGLDAARLDELLEPLEVTLDLAARDAELVAHVLDDALGVNVHLDRHSGLVVVDAMERH